MKKVTALCMAAVCALSLSACGSQKPSLSEVEKAISEGNVTIEDALEKGWVTQDWVDEYMKDRVVDASDKTESFAIGDFTTETLSGEEFTKADLSPVTFWGFVDPTDGEAQAYYQELVKAYEQVKAKGADIIVCTKSETETAMFADAPFPVIVYNDSVKQALGKMNMADMVEELKQTGNWYVNNFFASSWYAKVEAETLVKDTEVFVEKQKELSEGVSGENGNSSAAAVIG